MRTHIPPTLDTHCSPLQANTRSSNAPRIHVGVYGNPFRACECLQDRVCKGITTCMPGHFMEKKPTKQSDRVCVSCPNGKFTTTENAPDSCKDWSPCGVNKFARVQGSTKSNLGCEDCPVGQYQDQQVAPTKCKLITTTATTGTTSSSTATSTSIISSTSSSLRFVMTTTVQGDGSFDTLASNGYASHLLF